MDGLLSLAEGELPKIPRVQWFERARWFGMRVYLEFPWSTSDWTKEVWIQIRGKGRRKALYTKELFLDGCDTYAVAKHVTDATWGVRHLWTELEGGKVLKKKEEAGKSPKAVMNNGEGAGEKKGGLRQQNLIIDIWRNNRSYQLLWVRLLCLGFGVHHKDDKRKPYLPWGFTYAKFLAQDVHALVCATY